MSTAWKEVALGEVIAHRKEFIEIDDLAEYKRCRVKLHVKGIELRDTITGASIKTKKQQVCRAGEFLVAEIDAKVGGFGIVPEELEGAIVSSHYFLFEIDAAQLDQRFLGYFIKTPIFREQVNAQGSTNYAAIRPSHVLDYTIPLPPLSEQRRIVAKIDQLAQRIDEARRLRTKLEQRYFRLFCSLIGSSPDSSLVPMSELVEWRKPDIDVEPMETYHFAGVYCFGRGVFRGDIKSGSDFSYKTLTQIKASEFIYPKLMAWEGAMAVVPPECDSLFVSPEFPVFTINTERVLPEVLDVYFRNPAIWPVLSGASTGTNVRRRRLNPKDFLKHEFPLPDRCTQKMLRTIKNKIDKTQNERTKLDVELDALLSSILDRAFKGEL